MRCIQTGYNRPRKRRHIGLVLSLGAQCLWGQRWLQGQEALTHNISMHKYGCVPRGAEGAIAMGIFGGLWQSRCHD